MKNINAPEFPAHSLANCLRVAADRFEEDAKAFREAAKANGAEHDALNGWNRLAVTFDQQAAEALGLADTIDSGHYTHISLTD